MTSNLIKKFVETPMMLQSSKDFILSNKLTWESNTESIVNRVYAKMWIFRRVKALGGSKKTLKLIYFQHIHYIFEFGVEAWNGAISTNQSEII